MRNRTLKLLAGLFIMAIYILFFLVIPDADAQTARAIASEFPGENAGVKIQNACDFVAQQGGGTVDATRFQNGVIKQSILCGPAVTLQLPKYTDLIIDVRDGSDVFRLGEGSTLDCGTGGNQAVYDGVAGRQPPGVLLLTAAANIQALVAPANREGRQNFMFVNGCVLRGASGSTVSSALLDFQGVFIGSGARDTLIMTPYNTIGVRVRPGTGANGGIKIVSDLVLDNVQVNGVGVAGARPCVFETAASSSMSNITVLGGGCQHAGPGQFEIEVNGSANTANGMNGVFFYGQHMESRTGSLGVKIRDVRNFVWHGGSISGGGTASTVFDLSESVGSALLDVQILGVQDNGGSSPTNWVTNSANAGSTVPFASGRTLNYTFKSSLFIDGGGAFSNGVKIGASGTKISAAQHMRVAGCATAASVGAVCTTAISWSPTFSDANYTAVCNGDVVTSGVPQDGGLSSKTAGTINFRTVAATAAAAQYTTIDCVATHD